MANKIAVIGGLGVMASPMARHLKDKSELTVLRVHDRGQGGPLREKARAQWKAYGAELVSDYKSLIRDDLDGVIICAGKNGDDRKIISELLTLLTPQKFICHFSTVSTGFVRETAKLCASKNIAYVNYPLTGGGLGAENGSMLILASGDERLFERLKPGLSFIGKPRYFGGRVEAGAEVKFIGHLLVFNGLMGISSAVATQAECFLKGVIGGDDQAQFFDFLNGGAGGTKQWDISASRGVKQNVWDQAFSIKFAAVDAIYTAQLCSEKKLSYLVSDAVLNVALAFSYVLNHVGIELATQSILRELVASRARELDAFILKHSAPRGDIATGIQKCIDSFPESVRKVV